ncbi:hypothetical protein IRB23SM22_22570 [Alkalibacterium sp. s-m-22]
MYVAITGAGKSKVVQFVEQHRIPKTNKKKTVVIETIGNYEKLVSEDPDIIEKLKIKAKELTALKKQKKEPVRFEMQSVPIMTADEASESFKIGHHILRDLWKELALDTFFQKQLSRKNHKNAREAIFSLVIHRMMDPKSIRHTHQDLDNYAGLSSHHLDLYYNILDHLESIQDALIDHLCQQFEQKTNRIGPVAYYDVTTFSFESVDAGELRLFGYSKDNKSNEVQVVMGLLMDNQGIPISYQLFPGNTMDQSTLVDAVKDLKNRYQMDKIVIVADRGLNSKSNLAHLFTEGHDFVISYSLKKAPEAIKTIALQGDEWAVKRVDDNGEIIYKSQEIDYTLVEKVEMTEEEKANQPKHRGRPRKYKEIEIPTKIHLTWSKKRAEKDRKDRERVLEKVEKLLEKPSGVRAQLKRGRNQYIKMDADVEEAELDLERIARQAQYDGYYAIITNQLSETTENIEATYGGLWQIEESFRVMKSDLKARPVYVWTDEHVKGHFVLCFLAFSLLRYAQYRLRTRENIEMSGRRITKALNETSIVTIGEYPLITLIPTNISEDYLSLVKATSGSLLYSAMSLNEFRRATGLDLTINYINGQ